MPDNADELRRAFTQTGLSVERANAQIAHLRKLARGETSLAPKWPKKVGKRKPGPKAIPPPSLPTYNLNKPLVIIRARVKTAWEHHGVERAREIGKLHVDAGTLDQSRLESWLEKWTARAS